MTHSASATPGVRVHSLTWTPWGARPVLDEVSLSIEPGERVLITGSSGSGKSTLLRAMANVLDGYSPGDLTGSITVSGHNVGEQPGAVGLLLQNPRDQVVAGSVARDAAFGPENSGLSGGALRSLVRHTLDLVKLDGVSLDARSTQLSGGQGQRLSLSGLIGLSPKLLLLDEPLAMLDDDSADAVVSSVIDAVDAVGATMIVADHDLATWWPHVHRVVVLEHGRIVFDGAPADALESLESHDELWLPGRQAAPLAGFRWESSAAGPHGALLRADTVTVRDAVRTRLAETSIDLESGRAAALVGESGAGKSTLLRTLAGWQKPTSGSVTAAPGIAGSTDPRPHTWRPRDAAERIAFVGQDPAQGILASTVLDEVLLTRTLTGRLGNADRGRAIDLLESLGLAGRENRNPHTLSGGEQRRLSIAVAVASDAPIVLFDEPTVGQDRRSWAAVAGTIAELATQGRAIAVATHDDHLLRVVDTVHSLDRGQAPERSRA